MNARQVVLGVDSSTQSTKVEARDLDSGDVLAAGSASHPPTTPPVSEQDPDAWWRALVEACAAVPADVRGDVVAVSVAGQQHGLVLLDASGEPVRPAKLWNDTTSAAEAGALVEALGADEWASRTGTVPVPSITITKLAWVAAHEPDALARAEMVMLPHDYLTWRLSGRHVTDRGDASGSGWFDPVTNELRPELLELAGTDAERLAVPEVLAPAVAAGAITAEAAEALDLPVGVLIGPGTGDNMGAALGLGLGSGDVAISLGTSGVAFAASSTPTSDPSGNVAGFADATGGFLPLVCTLNATKVTDTVARWLGTDAAGVGRLALDAVGAPGDVTLVPYFDGERTPNLPDAAGELVGLTTATSAAQIALAAHDGVLCGLLDGLDALSATGATVDGTLVLVGGGNRSVAYRQRCADLSGRTVRIPEVAEAVAAGAAVQAAVVAGAGSFVDVQRAWGLGAGTEVTPANDVSGIRDRYRRASARLTES